MQTIHTYPEMHVQVINQTPNPAYVVGIACGLTQKLSSDFKPASKKTIQFLYTANHGSLLEHAVITVLISGVSRSFLAQITRHRMASYTSASQHYQNYSRYPHVMDPEMATMPVVYEIIAQIDETYDVLVEQAVPVEEARQILPGSKAVNILWTINARSLANFLNVRLCRRNVKEMRIFARRMYGVAKNWFPELFEGVGTDCEFGECRQGYLQPAECKRLESL